MAAKKRLVIANWKLYIESPDTALAFLRGLKRRAGKLRGVEIGIAPAFPLITPLVKAAARSGIHIGAQNVSVHEGGAHTGDVSAKTLKASGAAFAIVGHSERRAAGETDETVHAALRRADAAGLRIVLCIGERERDDHGAHFEIIAHQLKTALHAFPRTSAPRLVVAYEPVWAIGKTAADAMAPAEVRETVIFIRKILADLIDRAAALRVPVLYGGSAEPDNAHALLFEGEASGFLVGHASAELDPFIEILKACTWK